MDSFRQSLSKVDLLGRKEIEQAKRQENVLINQIENSTEMSF